MRNNGKISLQDSRILRSEQNFSAGTAHFQVKWRYEKSAGQCLPRKCIQLTGRGQYLFTKREMTGRIGYAAFAMSAIASSAQVAASTSANGNAQHSSSSLRVQRALFFPCVFARQAAHGCDLEPAFREYAALFHNASLSGADLRGVNDTSLDMFFFCFIPLRLKGSDLVLAANLQTVKAGTSSEHFWKTIDYLRETSNNPVGNLKLIPRA